MFPQVHRTHQALALTTVSGAAIRRRRRFGGEGGGGIGWSIPLLPRKSMLCLFSLVHVPVGDEDLSHGYFW